MYNAYGSASYPSAGTTNLHLDISDATNVIVSILSNYLSRYNKSGIL